ncbi:MAG: hypothetical protein INR65_08365 [Gluconacetobacter diazotrophicus]|nr:hypothetical protein [Gluconacetobacter diazotrophicus]
MTDHPARIAAIREEMRFEIGVFHDRINALISAEAFLLISFTMALAYAGHAHATPLSWIGPVLAAIGFTLAGLAWPGVATSYEIIVEWNILFMDALAAGHAASALRWRPSVFMRGDKRIQADHRRGMLFSRFVPVIFMIAWVVLAAIVLLPR